MKQLTELTKVIQPPAIPVPAGVDWINVEVEMGVRLPGDYKDYIDAYGFGYLFNHISIFTPSSDPASLKCDCLDAVSRIEDWLEGEPPSQYELFPRIPGILPCGYYGDIDIIAWLTEGQPDAWPIVYCSRTFGYQKAGGCGLVEFVLSIAKGRCVLPEKVVSNQSLLQKVQFRQIST